MCDVCWVLLPLFVCGFYFSWTENDQSFPFFRTRLGHKGSRGPESDIQTHAVHVWRGHLEAAEPQRRQEEGPNLLVLTHWCGMLQTRSWTVHLLCSYWVKPMARSLKGNKMLTYSWLVLYFQEVWESTVHHLANSFNAQPDHFTTHFWMKESLVTGKVWPTIRNSISAVQSCKQTYMWHIFLLFLQSRLSVLGSVSV